MNEFMIHERIKQLSNLIEKHKVDQLEADNQSLQDFVIWLKGFLDGNVSKRGEGKQ